MAEQSAPPGFELLGLVAQSPTTQVWRARDLSLDRSVALKRIGASAPGAAQLRREAHLLAGLSHPNIVTVYGLAEHDGRLWLIEEWVDGCTIDRMIDIGARFTTPQATGAVRGALLGLDFVHRHGLVHGDVSPRNIVGTVGDATKLVDFGLAAPAGTPLAAGTPGFRSPIAAAGQPRGPAEDIYGAAAVLGLLIRRVPVFPGRTPAEVLAAQFGGRALDLRGVPAATAAVLAAALSPQRPFSDVPSFLAALDDAADRDHGPAWLAEAGIAAVVAGVLAATATSTAFAGASGGAAATPAAAATLAPPPAAVPTPATMAARRRTRWGTARISVVGTAVVAAVAILIAVLVAARQTVPHPVAGAAPTTLRGSVPRQTESTQRSSTSGPLRPTRSAVAVASTPAAQPHPPNGLVCSPTCTDTTQLQNQILGIWSTGETRAGPLFSVTGKAGSYRAEWQDPSSLPNYCGPMHLQLGFIGPSKWRIDPATGTLEDPTTHAAEGITYRGTALAYSNSCKPEGPLPVTATVSLGTGQPASLSIDSTSGTSDRNGIHYDYSQYVASGTHVTKTSFSCAAELRSSTASGHYINCSAMVADITGNPVWSPGFLGGTELSYFGPTDGKMPPGYGPCGPAGTEAGVGAGAVVCTYLVTIGSKTPQAVYVNYSGDSGSQYGTTLVETMQPSGTKLIVTCADYPHGTCTT